MNKYNLIDRMNSQFSKLESALSKLEHQLIQFKLLSAHIFILPYIEKGTENNPIEKIAVKSIKGKEACSLGLQHFRRLFIHNNNQNVSSKAAVRLPDTLYFSVDYDEYLSFTTLI